MKVYLAPCDEEEKIQGKGNRFVLNLSLNPLKKPASLLESTYSLWENPSPWVNLSLFHFYPESKIIWSRADDRIDVDLSSFIVSSDVFVLGYCSGEKCDSHAFISFSETNKKVYSFFVYWFERLFLTCGLHLQNMENRLFYFLQEMSSVSLQNKSKSAFTWQDSPSGHCGCFHKTLFLQALTCHTCIFWFRSYSGLKVIDYSVLAKLAELDTDVNVPVAGKRFNLTV